MPQLSPATRKKWQNMAHPVIAPSRSVNIFMWLLPPIVASKKLHYQSHKQIRGPNKKSKPRTKAERAAAAYVAGIIKAQVAGPISWHRSEGSAYNILETMANGTLEKMGALLKSTSLLTIL